MNTLSTHRPRYPSRFGGIATASLFLLAVIVATAGCGILDRDRDGSASNTDTSGAVVVDSAGAATAAPDSTIAADSSETAQVAARPDSSETESPNATRVDSTLTASEVLLARIDSLSAQVARLADSSETSAAPVDFFADIGWKLVKSLLVLVIAYYVIRVLVWILGIRAERSATRRLTYMKAIPVVRIVVWTIALYYIIRFVFAVDGQQLIVAGGAIGVAIGFAAQDALKNVFGGIMIILDQPFQVGDKVRIEGTYGEVVSIGLRSTRIVTPDDNLVSVPNTQVVDGQVANANAGALDCQVVTEIFLPGWVDVTKAKKIAYDAAATSKYVYLEKPIVVLVQDFFDHGFLTRIVVKAYVLDTRYEQVFSSDITERAKSEYLKEGMLAVYHMMPPLTPPEADDTQ